VTAVTLFERRFAATADVHGALKPYLRHVHRSARNYLDRQYPDIEAALGEVESGAWV
jgi:hypothetical protein